MSEPDVRLDYATARAPTLAEAPTEDASSLSRGKTLAAAAGIFILTVLCNLPLLGTTPLAGTEGHRAITAHQMVQSGDWVLPKLYGKLYLAKPSLHYWLIALCEKLSGRADEFVWRMPAVLAAAVLNASLCLFGARWFGFTGGLVSGFCGLALVPLWGQVPSADVDSTNTLAAVLTALCLIELYYGSGARRRTLSWIFGAGLSLAATLLIKGPAGLPPILGVVLVPPVISLAALLWRRKTGWESLPLIATAWEADGISPRLTREWRLILSSRTWGPCLIVAVVVGTYVGLGLWSLHRSHLRLDWRGISEATNRLHPSTWARLRNAMLLPPLLFLYTLPVSLALPLLPGVLATSPNGKRADRIALALSAALLISWLVYVITGTDNPRWAYTTLPLLCPVAGFVAARARQRPPVFERLRAIVLISAGLVLITQLFLTYKAWHTPSFRFALGITAALSVAASAWVFSHASGRKALPGWGLAVLALLLTVPFTLFNRADRTLRSGRRASLVLEQVIGSGARVATSRVLLSAPEIFYYANMDVVRLNRDDPSDLRKYASGWVIAYPDELRRWSKVGNFTRRTEFEGYKLKAVLAWHSNFPTPDSQPATRGR